MNRLQYLQIDSDGRLVIPHEIRQRYGLHAGTKLALHEGKHRLNIQIPTSTLRRVYVEPTNICNLNCVTCMRNVWDESLGMMKSEIYTRIIEGMKALTPTPSIFLGGLGEPLHHPNIIEMVKQAKAIGARVELITNGTLLSEEKAKQFIDSGLDMLWFSIDGATPKSYSDVRLGDLLPQLLENIRRLRQLRDQIYAYTPQIGFAFVAMKRNIADLPEVIRMGINLGVKHFSVTNVLAYTPELKKEILYSRALYKGAYLSSADVLPHLSLPRIDIDEHTQKAIMELLRPNYLLTLTDGEIEQTTDVCPFVHRGSTAIRWDGALSPCLPLMHTYDSYLDERVRRSCAYSFGTLAEHDLKTIWELPDYVSLRETLQSFTFSPCTYCNSCEMANDNQEDCFGNILPTCGGCLWAQGLIQCP